MSNTALIGQDRAAALSGAVGVGERPALPEQLVRARGGGGGAGAGPRADHPYTLDFALSMARLWRTQDRREAARKTLVEVYGCFTEGYHTADLREARVLIEELGGC
jgi:hypothetical protein